MKKLKEMLQQKDKKLVTNLITAVALGLLLIICGSTFFSDKDKKEVKENEVETPETATNSNMSYEEELETELEEFLRTVEGVGDVEVMLTLSNKGEIVVAQDSVNGGSSTKETDAAGGQREQSDSNSTITHKTITGENGYQEPLILKKMEPEIEGVIISAEGGDNVLVQSELIKATQTVLGVEPHKVQVLKMEKNNE